MPPTLPPHYVLTDIWREYEDNTTRANATLTGTYVAVSLSEITRIEADGKIRLVVDEWNFEEVNLYIKEPREIIPLNPGDSITAVCKIRGLHDE